ncbi:MAG: TraR/DksA C4-type zinc finger protein [Thermomonas sp.]|nr:TraR/DksA C4-type zinc finger protein [Thermomonas sp.]MCC7097285.1 TraR/DksA C4-type zinc finger protein [Thermomonas sp.]
MQGSERLLEAAEHSVALERDARLAAIRANLREQGEDVCVTCDEPIEAERRAAMPSAARCVECQRAYERMQQRARND